MKFYSNYGNHFANGKRIIIITILFVYNWNVCQSQVWQWAHSYGNFGYQEGYGIIADVSGNSYVTGRFSNSFMMGNILMNGPGSNNIFITKLNSSGSPQWSKSAGGNGYNTSHEIGLDVSGNIYITGRFEGTIYFSGTPLTSNGGTDIYIAKYSNSGVLLWVKNIGGTGDDSGHNIEVDNTGHVIIAGIFSGMLTTLVGVLVSSGASDLFVARCDSSGNMGWIHGITDSQASNLGGIGVDDNNNVFVSGRFKGTLFCNNDSVYNTTGEDVFLIKIDSSGNILWMRDGSQQDNKYVSCNAMDTDKDGNSYLGGSFPDSMHFGNSTVYSSSFFNDDAYLCKFDSSGNPVWLIAGGGGGFDQAVSISCDNSGNIYQSGDFFGTMTYGNVTFPGNIGSPVASTYIIKADANGNCLWGMNEIGGSDLARFEDMYAMDSAIYQIGNHSNIATLGPFVFTGVGSSEILMGKLGNQGIDVEINPNISISPNPNSGTFSISYLLPQNKNRRLQICDLNGKIAFKQLLPPWSTLQQISLPENIHSGLYNCSIISDNFRVNRKVAIIR